VGEKVSRLCGRIFVCVGRLWRGVFVPIWGIGEGEFFGFRGWLRRIFVFGGVLDEERGTVVQLVV
jgi:hypothetical protein